MERGMVRGSMGYGRVGPGVGGRWVVTSQYVELASGESWQTIGWVGRVGHTPNVSRLVTRGGTRWQQVGQAGWELDGGEERTLWVLERWLGWARQGSQDDSGQQ